MNVGKGAKVTFSPAEHKQQTRIETMKAHLFVFLLFCSFAASAQNYSVQIDSLTRDYTARFARGQHNWIDSILAARSSSEWLKRLDTMQFDYAFIDETYEDGETELEERYFVRNDTIPTRYIVDGESRDVSIYYSGFTVSTRRNTLPGMQERYAKMLPNQELDYEHIQYWVTGCVVYFDSEEEFRQRREDLLRKSYAIRTMVDKVNGKVIVSVQAAPQNPDFVVGRLSMSVSF
jgi:hypothetical protein